LGEAVGGMDYGAVSMALGRFEKRLALERPLQRMATAARRRLEQGRGG
jgi:hypothetical protein